MSLKPDKTGNLSAWLFVRQQAVRLAPLVLALTALLAACANERTVGEALRLVQPQLDNAVVNEPYDAQIHAVGGLRPYSFRLQNGSLPEGITLQGGTLRGTPTTVGQYEFDISVSDGNLSTTVQTYRLLVTEVPPPAFTLAPPLTEVRDSVTLRARVTGARQVTAVRALVTWDPALFSLRPGSVNGVQRNAVTLVDEQEGQLQVDLAMLGTNLTGDHNLFTFVLEAVSEPTNLFLTQQVELLSSSPSAAAQHHFIRQNEGRRPGQTGPGTQPGGNDQTETGSAGDENPEDQQSDGSHNDSDDGANGGGQP